MSKKRTCKFLDKYTEEYPYIKRGRQDAEAYCSHCNSYMSVAHGGISDIKDHIRSGRHMKSVASSSSSGKITTFFRKVNTAEEDKIIASELCFAYHIVKHHQSFASASCVNKLFPKIFSDSNIAKKYSSAATKSTRMITKVLAPNSIVTTIDEIEKCHFYSISSDASNHKAEKIFPLIIQYFTITGIKVKLLKIGNLKGETSDIIAGFCCETLNDLKLDFKKCVAFGGDNANVNFGGRMRQGTNNVITKLKTVFGTEIEGIGCSSHILHNTMQTATDQLSCDVSMIVYKMFNYFSIYTVRTERLKDFCEFVNIHYEKLLSHSKARWLSLLPSIERILKMFEGLKSFFMFEDKPPKTFVNFFNNPLSEAYLWFIQSQASSLNFQILKIEGKNTSVIEVLNVLKNTLEMFNEKRINCFLPINVRKILEKQEEDGNITNRDVENFKLEIKLFYETFVEYLNKWMQPLEKFEIFSWMMLKEKPEWKDVESSLDFLKEKHIEINDTFLFDQVTTIRKIVEVELENNNNNWQLKNAAEKWSFVLLNMTKEYLEQYQDILKICEYLFSMSGHNANVERIFSLMEIQWTDDRNSLHCDTVEAILQCLVNFDLNCNEMYDYIIKNPQLLRQAKSNQKYF